jgi:hypothetical protein
MQCWTLICIHLQIPTRADTFEQHEFETPAASARANKSGDPKSVGLASDYEVVRRKVHRQFVTLYIDNLPRADLSLAWRKQSLKPRKCTL